MPIVDADVTPNSGGARSSIAAVSDAASCWASARTDASMTASSSSASSGFSPSASVVSTAETRS